jgi:hypothetical protein
MKEKYIDHYGIDSLPHLKWASRAGCDTFLTTNACLLEDRDELEEIFHIKILTPHELAEEAKLKSHEFHTKSHEP